MLTIDIPPDKKRKIERNKLSNSKRDAKDRNPHFSLTVEVKKGDDGRLEGLRSRLDRAKSLLDIDQSRTQSPRASWPAGERPERLWDNRLELYC